MGKNVIVQDMLLIGRNFLRLILTALSIVSFLAQDVAT